MRFLMIIALAAVLTAGSFLAFPLGFAQACETENAISFASPEQDKTGSFNFTVGEGGPVLDFVFNKNTVSVYNSVPPQELVQQIPYDPEAWPTLNEDDFIELVDMNFDGYLDIKIMSSMGNINVYYDCWLWNQDKKMFVLNEELSALSLPSFDIDNKTIASFTHNSAADNSEITYIFQNDKLKPVEIIEQAYDRERSLFITKVYRGDENSAAQLELVIQEEFTQEETEENMSYSDKDGVAQIVSEETLTENELIAKTEISMPFPGASFYQSPKGFSVLLPEHTVFKETAEGVDIRSENWVVIINQLGDAVDNLDNKNVQAELEKAAIGQSPLARCNVEWAYGTDTMQINNHDFYYRPFTGTLDGTLIKMGEFYYANINGKHFRIITAQLPDIGDSVILLVKMLRTIVVE